MNIIFDKPSHYDVVNLMMTTRAFHPTNKNRDIFCQPHPILLPHTPLLILRILRFTSYNHLRNPKRSSTKLVNYLPKKHWIGSRFRVRELTVQPTSQTTQANRLRLTSLPTLGLIALPVPSFLQRRHTAIQICLDHVLCRRYTALTCLIVL